MKKRMRGGSPAYDHHVAEGFLNNEATILSNMPLTNLESAPVENYANLYQISGGARNRRKRCTPKRRNSKKYKKGCGSSKKKKTLRNKLKKVNRPSLKKNKPKRCGCRTKNN